MMKDSIPEKKAGVKMAMARIAPIFALLCVLLTPAAAVLSRPAKRRNTWYQPVASAAEKLLASASELLHLQTPAFTFHMFAEGSKEALADLLWSGSWTEGLESRFCDANPALRFLLDQQLADDQDEPARLRETQGQSRWEAVMSALFRARSQRLVPVETAAMSIMWLYYRIPQPVWRAATYFGRSVLSRPWAEEMCDLAMQRDPGPAYSVVEGITAAVFDNLSMQAGYSSFMVDGKAGTRLEMTNWATVFLPATAMPAGFLGMDSVLGAGGIFKRLLDLDKFLDSFCMHSDDIVQNQRRRWKKYLDLAVCGSSIWETEHFNSPYPRTRFHFHAPIFDRLQSSYDDVNFELNAMRRSTFHALSDALMLGGDGLSFMRMIHRLSQDPRQYLETKPVVMPRMGENPHGIFHFMHGDWRIWAPLLLRLAAVVSNKQVKADPTIVDFNRHQHFLRIVTQALSEYVAEISQSGTHYGAVQHFLRDAERNLSFAYVVFFLFMFGFKYLDYRRAVRRNESHHLDLLWRENLASTRTAKANKVNYRQMSVILVYWGCALVEPLQTFYHNTRTIRWVHSHVGWDMPIEKLNMWIKESVISNITELQIVKFIWRLNFMQHVSNAIKSIIWSNRDEANYRAAKLKDIDADVRAIKEFLRTNIGSTYAVATQPSDANLLSVDMADWGGLRTPRGSAPFQQIRNAQAGYREYVEQQLTKLCPWQRWT